MRLRASILAILLAILAMQPASASRLFATSIGLGLVEISPQNGSVLNVFSPPEQAVWDSLAFDGQSLWFIGGDTSTLYKLNPDTGSTQGSFPLPGGVFADGMAYLNGLLYIVDATQDILVVNPLTGAVVNTLDFDGVNGSTYFISGGGLGAISGPDALLVNTVFTDEILLLNPATGAITSQFTHNQFGVLGAAGVDGEIYLGTNTGLTEQVYVYSRNGTEQRRLSIPGSIGVQSLAGNDAGSLLSNADFNNSGYVTTADFAKWQGDFGPNNGSDADGDGDSDGTDFLYWQSQFDPSAGPLSSLNVVPEPTSCGLLLGFSLLAMMPWRQLP